MITRRLAAIVVADVAGYSRLMERDETATHERLRSIFHDVVFPKVAQNGGRTVKTTGDGVLLEFASATSALRFAVEMQRDMAARNVGIDHDDRIDFRIGINVGDIIVDGDDIAGDGVNVAARLEPLAEQGGICVSSSVREQVREKLGVEFLDIGDKQVKNITKPIRVFRVVEVGAVARAWPSALRGGRVVRVVAAAVLIAGVGLVAWRLLPPGVSDPPARSVLVQPFATQDEDKEVVALTRALGPDVSRALANSMREVSVLDAHGSDAGSANVRYRLTADVRTTGDDVVVAASLVDASSNRQVASEQRTIERARIAQDRELLVARVTSAARQMIDGAETRRLAAGPADDARSLVARASAMRLGDVPSVRAARKVYQQAIDRDPSLVSAWLGRLYTLDSEYWYDFAAGRDEAIVAAMERDSLRALELDKRDPRVWFARQVALEAQWRWEAALEANARGQALDPSRFNEPILLLILAGRPQEALEPIARRNARLGKDDPNSLFAACNALLSLGRYQEALRKCERAVAEGADYWSYLNLVAVYAHTGDMARATEAKEQLMRNVPDFTISRFLAKRFSDSATWNESLRTHFIPGWRKAGVPE
jgi:class 3 adenylate cyclase/tetratricopeptide (TPR) repeat protein